MGPDLAGAFLLVAALLVGADVEFEETGRVGLGEHGSGGVFDGDAGFEAAFGAAEAAGEVFEPVGGPLEARGSQSGVAGGFGAGTHPDDPESLARGQRRLERQVHVVGFVASAGRVAGGFDPVRGVAGDPVPEPAVFFAGAGQDGHEPAAVFVDVLHGGTRRELAVGHVEEVLAADQGDKLVPGRDMRGVVVGVARGDPVSEGNGPIGGHGEDPHQLAQIGPVVLAVPERHRRHGLPAPGAAECSPSGTRRCRPWWRASTRRCAASVAVPPMD